MGYLRVEKFDTLTDFAQAVPSDPDYTITTTDWDSYLSSGKTETLRVDFNSDVIATETYFSKSYATPIEFVVPDMFGKPQYYRELRLTMFLSPGLGAGPVIKFTQPGDFIFSMSIWRSGAKLREWFLPLRYACAFECHTFDLNPLIEAGHTSYDELRVHILKSPGDTARLYFGDMWLVQDEVEHNLAVTIADMLHCKFRRLLTTLDDQANPGDTRVALDSIVDVHENMAIAIGDPDGLHELHVIKTAPYQHGGRAVVEFNGEFDTEKIIMPWAAGTQVWFVVPAVFGELTQSEAVFPVFYVAWEAPEPVEEMSRMHDKHFSNYVRDTSVDEEHLVAVSLGVDMIRMKVDIHVYAQTQAVSVEMWRYLRSIFDNQSHISIAGIGYDYVVNDYKKVSAEPGDILPHYTMGMDCYPTEFVHKLNYLTFPALKSLTIGTNSAISSQTTGMVPVEVTLPP